MDWKEMTVIIDDLIVSQFPDLRVMMKVLQGTTVKRYSEPLERFKNTTYDEVKRRYSLESLRNVPRFRLYRDFFWRIGIDPTKNRPAAEALIRRILAGKPMPQINTLVDTYNIASIYTEIALAAFDFDRLKGDLVMRFAHTGEEFMGIGMEDPMILGGGEIIISDASRLVAVYPYRDADYSKITLDTKNLVLLVCGVPGIESEVLEEAGRTAFDYLLIFCGGSVQPSTKTPN